MLQHGARINAVGQHGRPPLYYAMENARNVETVRVLLQHGADPLVVDQSGHSVLHHAIHSQLWNNRGRVAHVFLVDWVRAMAGPAPPPVLAGGAGPHPPHHP